VTTLFLLMAVVVPPDSLLVDVRLLGVGDVMVEATMTDDSGLVLAAPPVFALLGLGVPPTATVALDAIRRRYPIVTFAWLPRELALIIEDPRGVLPATATARSAIERVARGAFTALSGPFATLTGDDRGRSAAEAGYTWRGRVAVSARRPAVGPATWAATLAPSPALVAGVTGADRRVTSATWRLALGPAWAFTTWAPGGRLAFDGLVAVPHAALFASTRDVYVLTILTAPLGVQLGRSGSHITARVTYGPVGPSPFVVPVP
jgi:hypothetical protein